ncbi:DNRLRE domain-containing protein [bacterium]|nr:DNRLRE domain-containing protein [bacterium]
MSRRLAAAGAVAALLGIATAAGAAVTLEATADTFVDSEMATVNFAGFSIAEVGVGGAPKYPIDRALLAFDLGAIPAGTEIRGARLRILLSGGAPDPPDLPVTVALVDGGFDEATVTWNTQPAVLPSPIATAVVSETIGSVATIDVSELVRAQRAGPMPAVLSLRIAASDESTMAGGRLIEIATSDAQPPRPPLLVIDLPERAVPALSGGARMLVLAALSTLGVLALRRRERERRRSG